jgi:hypothetical protein
MAALAARRLHKREPLEKEHREDAGHQVEDDATYKCQPQSGDRRKLTRLCATLRFPESDYAGSDRCRHFVRLRVTQFEHTTELMRKLHQLRSPWNDKLHPIRLGLDGLIGCVGDLLLI